MAIEAKALFLGKIPVGLRGELSAGDESPGDVVVDWGGLAMGIVSTIIWDHGISMYIAAKEENAVRVLDKKTLEVGQSGLRILLREHEINRAKISSPTLIPGLRFHYRYKG